MPTVAEILKQTGLNDEQIAAIDAKVVSGFSSVLSTAEQERILAQQAAERAEIEKRANAQFYDQQIAPALNQWGTEKANLEAQAAFYRAQNEAARAAGFIADEPPGGFQPRDNGGRFVAGAPGGTPGSPTFTMEDIDRRLGSGLSNMGWAMQEYQRLNGGQFLPDPIDRLAQEADGRRMNFRDYVSQKYDFQGKQAVLHERTQREHDDKIRAEERAVVDRKWAEKIGSNPDVRLAQSSRFSEVSRAVKAGDRPDPLKLDDAARRRATSQAIRSEIADRGSEVA